MQNPKTGGSRWVPDIRPENIDTYTEQDGEQNAQYKIVDAHPIIGGVLDKLAFFRTHASAVWYNKLKNITVLQKLDNLASNIGVLSQLATTDKSSLVNALNELNGKMAIRSLLFRENIPPNTEYVYDDNVSLGSILLLGGTWNHKEMYVLYISYIEEGWRNLIVNRIASYNSYSTFEFRITDAGKLAIKNITEVTQPTLAYMIDSP